MTDELAAGPRRNGLGVKIATTSDLAPTTTSIQVMLHVEYTS